MRDETSAGGVVYRKKSNSLQFLLLKDKNNHWTFPKGLIEKNEEKERTAEREIGEETGLKEINLISELTPIKYWYKWENDLIHKTVYYFLFEEKGDEVVIPQQEEGISDVQWFSPEETLTKIGYRETNLPVLKEVMSKINVSA